MRVRQEVTAINPTEKTVTVHALDSGKIYTETYDKLLLAPGAKPTVPALSGVGSERVFTLRTVEDTLRIRHCGEDQKPKTAILAGGGFIGLEMAENLAEKMQKRGLPLDFPTMQTNIMDIAGVRVICSFEEDVFFLAKCLKKQSDIEIITEKDYISHPKPNGYRSLHLTIRLPVFFAEKEIHVPVEIQLRTIAMDFWASLEHTIRYKKNLPINAEVETELKECADSSREWDSKMEHLLHILT